LAALLCALALGLAPAAGGQDPKPQDPSDLVNALLTGFLGFGPMTEKELQQEVAEIGGIPFRRDVPIEFLSHEGLTRYFEELFDSEYPPEKADADTRLLRALDLMPPNVDLRRLRLKLLLDNVVGFYDERPGKQRLFAVSADKSLTPANQLVLAHELRHALQDQYMRIHELVPDSVPDFDDRRLALLGLLEGDATFVMQRFLQKRLPGGEELPLDTLGMTLPPVEMPGVPAVLRDELVLPYVVGLEFVRALHGRGGWQAVKDALGHPPESSEQILHAEKYFEHERPRPVTLRYVPPGGRVLEEGVLGELLLRTLLGEGADAAAAGWGGDLYRVYDVRGKTLVLARSVWDSPKDQQEFLAALLSRYQTSHGAPIREAGFSVFEKSGSWVAVGESLGGVVLIAGDDGPALKAAIAGQ
jgi:hypothetical protein